MDKELIIMFWIIGIILISGCDVYNNWDLSQGCEYFCNHKHQLFSHIQKDENGTGCYCHSGGEPKLRGYISNK